MSSPHRPRLVSEADHARLKWLIERLVSMYRWYVVRRDRCVFRLLRCLFAIGVPLIIAWSIWKRLAGGYMAISMADLEIAPHRLIISGLCVLAATILGAWEWVFLVNAMGGRLGLGRGLLIQFVSNLAKYVPGFVWSYAGKAYLASRSGVPSGLAVLSVMGEFAIVYVTGILVMLSSLPFSGLVPWTLAQQGVWLGGALVLTGLSIWGGPVLGRRLAGLWEQSHPLADFPPRVNWVQVRVVMVAVLLTWWLLGFGFSTLCGPGASDTGVPLLRHALALALALLLGQVAIFVPMGLGVREGILVGLLATSDTAALIILLAVVFRLEMMVGEILCALLAVVLNKLFPLCGGPEGR